MGADRLKCCVFLIISHFLRVFNIIFFNFKVINLAESGCKDLKKNQSVRSKLLLFVPPVLAILFMLAIFFANGIFPFGEGSIVYDDMTQCNVPAFYAVWDALHGDGGLLFNWKTASGIFVQGVFSTALSPFNLLFFLICPREMILECMSFFLILKIALCAFTSMLFFSKKFKISPFWHMLFSLMYAFNSYILQYFVNISWLEIVAAFPLVLLALDHLFRRRKIAPYVLVLTYCLMIQLYISYMLYIYLFLVVGLYIIMVIPKEIRKVSILNFGIGSVLAIFLSAFSSATSYFSMTASSRFQSAKSYRDIVVSAAGNSVTKLGMLLILTALPTAIVFLLAFKIPKEKRKIGFCLLAVLTCAVPVFFENINLMWHMGTYVMFSMRFAFMLHLTLLTCSCFAIERFGSSLFFKGKSFFAVVPIAVSLCAAGFAAWLILNKIYTENSTYAIIDKVSAPVIILTFLFLFFFYVITVRFGIKRLAAVTVCVMVLFEIGFFANRAFSSGKPRQAEYSHDFIFDSNTIYDELDLPDDNITRIKNIDASLNSNYPLIIGYPAMSNFTHIIPLEIKKNMINLGYSFVYTRILDTGGTYFSDALLGCKYTISASPLSDEFYSFKGMAGDYFVCESDFSLPFGVVADGEIIKSSINGANVFAANDNAAKSIFGEGLFDFPDYSRFISEKNDSSYRTATYTLKVEGQGCLYAAFPAMSKRKCLRIKVNGESVPVPSLDDPTNDRFSTRFNNGALNLGSFDNESVTIEIDFFNESVISPENLKINLAVLDTKMLSELCMSANGAYDVQTSSRSLTVKAVSKDGGDFLFLPIAFDEGWKCKVNGNPVKIETAVGAFMAVKLEKGVNNISLSFMPHGMRAGIVISVLSLLALIAIIIYNRKHTVSARLEGRFLTVLEKSFIIAVFAAYTAVYIVPMIVKISSFIISKL
jgi:uncharacterized membrane protein YfhO